MAAIESSPQSTFGFGPREDADASRQSQHSVSNDAPTDVNFNAIVARSQALTVNLLGKNFEANADRRNKLFDQFAAAMAKPA
ncbi:MAG: hypothetical protein CMN84_05910 [Spongiibacteraceae bacterium]|nr:hypothetical protein [Spongiibacteraceae bacterium]